jgi:catechol 2,3-dioxygenase-like lactoylglutathione lyase family enzyme
MQLLGIHHLTAVSADAPGNKKFYTQTLGMRLVKKTVNQDDVSAYHLFYADGKANPGTDLTFFDFPAAPEQRGTNSISRTGLRVAGEKTLGYWRDRLKQAGVATPAIGEGDRRFLAVALRKLQDRLDQSAAVNHRGQRIAGDRAGAERGARGAGDLEQTVLDRAARLRTA